MLAPEERSQQAVAAAQRAYGDDIQRRNSQHDHSIFRSSSVRFLSPVDNRNELCDSARFRSADKYDAAGESRSTLEARATAANHVSYDMAAGTSYSTYATKSAGESSAVMILRDVQQLDNNESTVFQQPVSSGPRGRRALNLSDLGADHYNSPGSPAPSTPSSYRRLRKTRSVFSVSQVCPPQALEESPVVYSSEISPKGGTMRNRRKSMSFLRGGTDFMPESVRRQLEEQAEGSQAQRPYVKEQKAFYLTGSSRRSQKPIAFPETVRAKKAPKDPQIDLVSVRKAVGEKARKVFGSVKRVFGVRGRLEDAFPEQQVTSTRPHFREYISPSEMHEDIQDISEPNNMRIRSTVVSRAPTFRNVPSVEMLRSIAGSIRDASTSPVPPQTPNHTARRTSVVTDGTSTWNSTLDRRSAAKKRLSIIDENTPHRVRESIYEPPEAAEEFLPRYEVRRVYSALMKRLDEGSPNALRSRQEYVRGQGYSTPVPPMYYMAPGLGLRPEEERMFEQPLTAISTATAGGTIRKSNASQWARPTKPEQDRESDPFYSPSVTDPSVVRNLAAQKGQSYGEITGGWQKDTEIDDGERVGMVTAVSTLSLVASSSHRDGTPNSIRPSIASGFTPPGAVHGPQGSLRATRSNISFPYSTEEFHREHTPSPYKRARSTDDIKPRAGHTNSLSTLGQEHPAPPPPLPLRPPPPPPPLLPSPGTTDDASLAPKAYPENAASAKGKFKIRGNLKMKDYYYPAASASAAASTSTTANRNSRTPKPGSQPGIGFERSRSKTALTERTSRDIENAVNSQFGPVAGRGGGAKSAVGRIDSPDNALAFI